MTVKIDSREALYEIVFFDYIAEFEYKIDYVVKATGNIVTIKTNYNGSTTLQDREFKALMKNLAKKKAGM
jgi:hypothetical protein